MAGSRVCSHQRLIAPTPAVLLSLERACHGRARQHPKKEGREEPGLGPSRQPNATSPKPHTPSSHPTRQTESLKLPPKDTDQDRVTVYQTGTPSPAKKNALDVGLEPTVF
ncbi:hypothetical protein GQ53DRAFT_755620 [Thozetella sp. PMI_491]|nr:hypothetical protein GQ53DRAFT_755620 [Thozetella sp. PMI_491]